MLLRPAAVCSRPLRNHCRNLAGHSKWANIKHKKKKNDTARQNATQKLVKEIEVAALSGDEARLAAAVRKAKSGNVSKATIDSAITRTQDASNRGESMLYEAQGPHGTLLLIESITENKSKSAANLRATFNKLGGQLGSPGSAAFAFEQQGLVEVDCDESRFDEATELCIEAGAEEVELGADGRALEVTCAPAELQEMLVALAEAGLEANGEVCQVPTQVAEFVEDSEEALAAESLVDALEALEGTVSVTCNAEIRPKS